MAMMTVESKWTPDKPTECLKCYETASIEHPGVRMVAMERGAQYIGGKLEGLGVPTRDFPCKTPKETRADLPEDADVVAFQARRAGRGWPVGQEGAVRERAEVVILSVSHRCVLSAATPSTAPTMSSSRAPLTRRTSPTTLSCSCIRRVAPRRHAHLGARREKGEGIRVEEG